MATYSVNRRAVAQARRLIDAHQYVLESEWGEVASPFVVYEPGEVVAAAAVECSP